MSLPVGVPEALLVGALPAHGVLRVRGGSDPHALFGVRPFDESDTMALEAAVGVTRTTRSAEVVVPRSERRGGR